MNRLAEEMVFSGLSTAWRLASWPTRRSAVLVNPATDGVKRLPSLLMITVGLPPSITATTEFVVPRSMPTAFAISHLTIVNASYCSWRDLACLQIIKRSQVVTILYMSPHPCSATYALY